MRPFGREPSIGTQGAQRCAPSHDHAPCRAGANAGSAVESKARTAALIALVAFGAYRLTMGDTTNWWQPCTLKPPPLFRLMPINDEGNAVAFGLQVYCGQKRDIPKTDGQCGPLDGGNCKSCMRFTKEMEKFAAWMNKASGLSVADAAKVLHHFSLPEYEITTIPKLKALSDADIDDVLKGMSLGTRSLVKKAARTGV